MTVDTEAIRRSVTKNDYADDPRSGAANVWYFMAPQTYARPVADLLPFWSFSRDVQLRSTTAMESMWAAAVHKAITKRAARGFTVDDPQDKEAGKPSRRTRWAQSLLLAASPGHGTPGWVPFLLKHLRDFLTTDNGAFIEVIRATSAAGSRIVGLAHLDSLRCRRTGDPDVPVLYRDRRGYEHELRDHQVLLFSDMPHPGDLYYGVGECAASRSYGTIAKLAAVERYVYEKVSGNRALALHFVQGVAPKQLEGAMLAAEQAQLQKGVTSYMGAVVIPVMGDAAISLVTIPLAEIPDGFDAKQLLEDGHLVYANNIGISVQELRPLSGQGLGTGTQSIVLDEAQQEVGLAAWDKQLTHALNEYVLPESTTFSLVNTNDMRDQAQKANVANTRATERSTRIQSGEISPAMARQLAVDAGDLPPELVPADETGAGTLDDDDKPRPDVVPAALAMQAPDAPPKAGPAAAAAPASQAAPAPLVGNLMHKAYKDANHDGVMVAFMLTGPVASKLVSLAGVTEPIENLHVTLAYLGNVADVAPYQDTIRRVLAEFAHGHAPVEGTINGVGRFANTDSDGTNAVYANYDAPALPRFRGDLVEALQAAGVPVASNHGYTPHITLAYVPEAAPTPDIRPPQIPLAFNSFTLAWGEERSNYPLIAPIVGATNKELRSARDELAAALALLDEVSRDG